MVSVVIPIFNVRKFIGCGLENILKQTYQDFEILLSDDGSTDGSYEECQRWELKDKRIHVLHQENKGAGAARNHGIDCAKGEFIYFFDIDDEISPILLEYCVKTMNEQDVDFICFGYDNVEISYNSRVRITFPEIRILSNKELRNVFVDQFVLKENGFPWNKFYRKSYLNKYHLRYEDQRIEQDEVFNLKCYKNLDKAYLSSEVLYTYYVYDKGNTRSHFIPDRFDIYKSVRQHFEALKCFWSLNDKRLEDYLNKRFYTSVLQCLFFNLTHPDCFWTKKEKQLEIDRIMSDCLTCQSFRYAETNIRSFEHRLYRGASRSKKISCILLCSKVPKIIYLIKKSIGVL